MFQQGRHNSARLMAVRSVRNDSGLSRFAYAISRRVGTAVVRNRLRRRLREALRVLPIHEGYDVVIVARPEAAKASYYELKRELTLLFKRARVLDGPG